MESAVQLISKINAKTSSVQSTLISKKRTDDVTKDRSTPRRVELVFGFSGVSQLTVPMTSSFSIMSTVAMITHHLCSI